MTIDLPATVPGLGQIVAGSGLIPLDVCSDGRFRTGRDGVLSVTATGDRKVEFVAFADHTLAYVRSALGYPAYYSVHPVALERPVRAVLMDLDGTSVHSEGFWIRIIERTTASLLGNPNFELEPADLPFVSGHSVSEHLAYCVRKYCPDKRVEEARDFYFEHTRRELQAILEGRGRMDAFVPAPGLKEFLLALKERRIKIALVTSGLHEKAWPEIVAAFRTLKMGDPRDFYDAIITAGFPLHKGEAGTLGELSPARIGLGIPFEARNSVLGIEDSGAGVCAIRLAGFPTVGMAGGNIIESGTRALCQYYCDSFEQALAVVEGDGLQ
jgi:beta-phosphoglucomutase